MYHQSGPHSGPPPICFNCSKEGHFLVNCPEPKRTSIGGPPVTAPGPNPLNGNYSGSPAPQWTNGQNMGASGAAVTHYQKPPPVVTRYAVPGQSPQYGTLGSYGPSPTAPPYQYSGSAPPGQSFTPLSQTYQPPQYGGSAPPYSHNPPPQSYSAPPPDSQYGQGYQQQPHNQYLTSHVAPHYHASPAQPYNPPTAQYQSPVRQYPPRNDSYSGPPPPQWNNTTPIPVSSPYNAPPQQFSNQQRQNSDSQREYSGTPSYQPQQQQTPQNEHGPGSDVQQTPQTPTPSFNPNETAQASQGSPPNESYFPKSATESVPSSRASTPYGRYGSVSSSSGKQKVPSVSVKSSPATPTVHMPGPISLAEDLVLKEAAKEASKKEVDEAEDGEEGEYTEKDLLQEQFNWDYKKIFKEPTATEHVALSQPLSYTFTVTPVPLMDPRWAGSVSRYARKENLKEYLKPIRSQPQWDYLKEDPAFSDVKLEGPLIPLKELHEWMSQRQGIDETPQAIEETTLDEVLNEPALTRKRAWSDEQEDVDNQIQLETSGESIEQPSKRQKNEAAENDYILADTSGTPAPGTPIIGRADTPTFGAADDVWAPEPGEAASAPMDPTEALLASLGVSGAPKPVREDTDLVNAEDHHVTPPFGSIPHSMSPQVHTSSNNTPHNISVQNLPPQGSQGSPQGPPQNHPRYGNPQYNFPQQGSPPNGNPYGAPQPNVPYSSHGIPVYNNNIAPQPSQNYGPPQQYGAPYGNPPPPQRQPSYNNNQYGSPQGTYPPQSQYGPPQNQQLPQPQFNGPPNIQYGPSQPQWNGVSQGQYNVPLQNQYVPSQAQHGTPQPQYSGQPQGEYGPTQGQNGGPPHGQWGPPQGQYGPPQDQYSNGYPSSQGPPQYGNPAYSTQGNPQYANGPQQGNPQGNPSYRQFNNQGNQPPRQDSGYASARGSYSNGSVPNGFSNDGHPQHGAQRVNGNNQSTRPSTDGANEKPSPVDTTPTKIEAEVEVENEDTKPIEPESPLSPTSAEILGKLTQHSKPRKIIRVISGKNKGQIDEAAAKKLKRPAPVVAEAYSRRW